MRIYLDEHKMFRGKDKLPKDRGTWRRWGREGGAACHLWEEEAYLDPSTNRR